MHGAHKIRLYFRIYFANVPGMNSPVRKAAGNRSVGRPRILDRERVIAAALAVGTDRVTMKSVADELGVGVATLYKYVSGRQELMQLVALELMGNVGLPRRGRLGWAEYSRRFALALEHSMVAQPAVIRQLMEGGFGNEIGSRLNDEFVGSIRENELSRAQASELYQAICQVAIGGAITSLEVNAARTRTAPAREANSDGFDYGKVDVDSVTNLLLDALVQHFQKRSRSANTKRAQAL